MTAQLDTAATTADAASLVTTATSQPALRTGFVVLGLTSLLNLSSARHGADRMLAVWGAAAAGWYLVDSRRRHLARPVDQVVDRRTVVPASVEAAGRARSQHLGHGHSVVPVGCEYRQEVVDQVDRRSECVVQQHH